MSGTREVHPVRLGSLTCALVVAFALATPRAHAESPPIPCTGGVASPSSAVVPSNLPSFVVRAWSPVTVGRDASEALTITLEREEGTGTVPVAGDVWIEQAGTELRVAFVPSEPLLEGYVHVLRWNVCTPAFGGGSFYEQRYSVGPATPLPAPTATVAARVIAVVQAGSLWGYSLEATLEASSALSSWEDSLDIRAEAGPATTGPGSVEGNVARFSFAVSCLGFGGVIGEGPTDVRARVGGWGAPPVIDVSTTHDVECTTATWVDVDTGHELTPAEIDEVRGRADAGPTLPDAGSDAGPAGAGLDGGVGMVGAMPSCAVARGHHPVAGVGLVVAALLFVCARHRRVRRS